VNVTEALNSNAEMNLETMLATLEQLLGDPCIQNVIG